MGVPVRRLATANENVHLHIRYSQPEPGDVKGQDYDDVGHVSVDVLKRLLPPAAYDFYLCGPTPFMKSLYNGLVDWGVAESRINYEFFGPATALKPGEEKAPKRIADSKSATTIEVAFNRSQVTLAWDESAESILELAEMQGLRPEYSCRSGICHTCMCTLIAGEVTYVVEPADLPDPGCVLICCSKPRTNVVLDL